VRKKRVGHDTENSKISLLLDPSFTNVAHSAPAIIQRTGKRGKIMLTLNKLATFIHHPYVQHFRQEQGESSTKRRARIAIQNMIAVLTAQGITSDIEIIVGPVSRLNGDVAR
jgi:hypothetical protein